MEIAKIEFTKLLWNWFPNLFLLQIIKDIISGMDFSQILLPCVSSFYILTAWRSRTNALTTTQCLKMTQKCLKKTFLFVQLWFPEKIVDFFGWKTRENVWVLSHYSKNQIQMRHFGWFLKHCALMFDQKPKAWILNHLGHFIQFANGFISRLFHFIIIWCLIWVSTVGIQTLEFNCAWMLSQNLRHF